ncbi:MAG: hotdog fold thioesterase [Candidatus Latescibacterota bacterium]
MEWIKGFFRDRDRFAAHCGIELLEVGPGSARTRMVVGDEHLNGADTVHGGAIFTLADFAFAAASNSHGTLSLAINVSISYLKGAGRGTVLTAQAEEVAPHPRLASYAVRVTDEAGELVAIFQGMVYRKKERLEELLGGPPPRT